MLFLSKESDMKEDESSELDVLHQQRRDGGCQWVLRERAACVNVQIKEWPQLSDGRELGQYM